MAPSETARAVTGTCGVNAWIAALISTPQTRIAELEAVNKELVGAMIHCIESIRSIKWGYDGDGGAWNAVEVMDDKLAEIQSKANGGENT